MAGVDVVTGTISGPTASAVAPGDAYFAVGITHRGPTDRAVLVRSLAEFEFHFGPRVTYGALHDDLRTFFSEGGSRAYIARVVGAAAVKASRTLVDRAGAPLDTLTIEAVDPGDWANSLTVEVVAGTDAGTFRINISGTPDGEDETFDNLATPIAAADAISAGSRWVNASDEGSVTAGPNNQPALLAPTALTGGTDDRAALVAASYVAGANNLFTPDLGAGLVAVPGQPSSAVGAGLLLHAQDRNRLAALTTIAAQTPTQAKAAADAMAGLPGSEHGGLFYPWVKVPADAGTTRTISPTGYVAAVRARAHHSTGPWRAPAGLMAQARFLLGLERELTRLEGDDLEASRVSAIRTIQRTTRLYGWWSLSNDRDNYALLTGRDVINDLVVAAERKMEDLVFETIDSRGHLFSQVYGILEGEAAPMRSAGGLYERRDAEGNLLDKGYAVDTGPAVNTEPSIARGEVRGSLAVRVAPTGSLIVITISKAAQSAAL